MATTKYFWQIHNLFYDPPGTPPHLRCISCRYASAGAAGIVGLGAVYGVAKTMPRNAFYGMGFVFLALVGFGSSGIALRMASLDKHWNETRFEEYQKEYKAKRSQFKEKMNSANQ